MRPRETFDPDAVIPRHLRWVNRPPVGDPSEAEWVAEWTEWHRAHGVDPLDALRAINLGEAS